MKPSNLGQGYILRRLIRRSIRHGRKLGLEEGFLGKLAAEVITIYRDAYPELGQRSEMIVSELGQEEGRFSETLQKGEKEFEKLLPNLMKNPQKIIPGRVAFRLYDTYGFPIEITEELAREHGMGVDRKGFDEAFEKHQELSKAGAEKIFKGGLADHSEMTTKLHTATHLLHQALRTVLGTHVAQKGSNITVERLRFDFSHPQPMTEEQVRKVEAIVNEQIRRDLPVSMEIMTLEQARAAGRHRAVRREVRGKGEGLHDRRLLQGGLRRAARGAARARWESSSSRRSSPRPRVCGGSGRCSKGSPQGSRRFAPSALRRLPPSARLRRASVSGYGVFCSFSSISAMPRFFTPIRCARVSTSSALSLLSSASQLCAISR